MTDIHKMRGLVIEYFGDVLFLNYYVERCRLSQEELRNLAVELYKKDNLKAVYVVYFEKNRFEKTQSRKELLAGEAVSEWVFNENDVLFKLKTEEGFSRGIFLDQKENRKLLAEMKASTVLNCFSYTCGFGVCCAKAGSVTYNVDLSKKYLEWGKENYRLNSIPLESHFFYARDVFEFLKKTDKKFDLIILDPPSFSRTKEGKVFSVEKDYKELLLLSEKALAEDGRIFFSSNLSIWNKEDLERNVLKVFSNCKIKIGQSFGNSVLFSLSEN